MLACSQNAVLTVYKNIFAYTVPPKSIATLTAHPTRRHGALNTQFRRGQDADDRVCVQLRVR